MRIKVSVVEKIRVICRDYFFGITNNHEHPENVRVMTTHERWEYRIRTVLEEVVNSEFLRREIQELFNEKEKEEN